MPGVVVTRMLAWALVVTMLGPGAALAQAQAATQGQAAAQVQVAAQAQAAAREQEQAPPEPRDAASPPAVDAAALYGQHCAACHAAQRTGAMGPALLPESLVRLRPAEALRVIRDGRPATQMPGFVAQLAPAEIDALAQWIRSPVEPAPHWDEADIRASRSAPPAPPDEPQRPSWQADPMNLFVVVEGGDHHVSLLDGDRFEVLARFPSRYALHGGPKFTPDGRYVFFGSRDGWITKYDLWRLRVVAEVRAGLNMRNVAVSSDGRWVVAANYLPHTLVLFDAGLNLVSSLAVTTRDGLAGSRVSAVYDAAPRNSFIVALKDIAELWELPYATAEALARDRRRDIAADSGEPAVPRRITLAEPLDDFFFDQAYRHVLGATRPRAAGSGRASAQVVDLDAGRRIADLPLAGMPHLGSGITFDWEGRSVLASPNLEGGVVDVIDMENWRTVRSIPTPGPGFFLRSHENTPYAWTDSMMSPAARDTLTIIDKRSLEVVAKVSEPGRTLAHVEFTRDGRHALASVLEMDGAIVVYDADDFREIKRLPMRRPVGKYNVWNKINRSEGTSH